MMTEATAAPLPVLGPKALRSGSACHRSRTYSPERPVSGQGGPRRGPTLALKHRGQCGVNRGELLPLSKRPVQVTDS
jgi:hypothetical protein